jgi:hypothetical protein
MAPLSKSPLYVDEWEKFFQEEWLHRNAAGYDHAEISWDFNTDGVSVFTLDAPFLTTSPPPPPLPPILRPVDEVLVAPVTGVSEYQPNSTSAPIPAAMSQLTKDGICAADLSQEETVPLLQKVWNE